MRHVNFKTTTYSETWRETRTPTRTQNFHTVRTMKIQERTMKIQKPEYENPESTDFSQVFTFRTRKI